MVLWPEASTVPWLRVMSSLVWGGWTRKTVVDSGTAAAPSVTTTNDLDTGIYFPSAGQAAFAIDGVQRLLGTATYWQSSNPVYLPLGSAAAPSQAFTGDTNTGVYSTGADKWAVAVAGARFFELGGGDAYIAGRMTGYPVSQFPAFGSYGGTANAITVNTGGNSQDIGTTIAFKATAANTGATTINANGLGATACVTPTYAALPAGYIRTDVITIATLTGSGWMVGRLPEYGSGTNGEWWRYEDGRQECISAITTSASAEASVTFEKAFSSVPRVTLGVNSSATFAISPRFTGLTTSGLSVSAYNTSNARIAAQVEYHAVGKWF